MNTPTSDLTIFIGRFHPLLVHLPIGFLVLMVGLEALALLPRFRQANSDRGLILALAVPVAVLSAVCGWLLSRNGGYDDRLVQIHQWTGFGAAAATLIVFILHRLGRPAACRLCLFGTCALLMVAGHYGASLTHGSDYLTHYAPSPLRAWLGSKPAPAVSPPPGTNSNAKSVFAVAVQPIFKQYCVGCHGPEKSKAELRLDSLAGLTKGGESGPALTPGNSTNSPIIKRLRLPSTQDDHMPPEGKPQPSPDDVALIQWWIDAGAHADTSAEELVPPENIRRLLQARGVGVAAVSSGTAPAAPKPLSEVLPVAVQLADDLGISISAVSPDEPWLQANASLATTNFGDTKLAKLAALSPNLRWLDLGGTRTTDASLPVVAHMPNLTRLHLERTGITDAGLTNLAGLENLEYLNLYGTSVTDAGLAHLKSLRHLHQLYLWQTKVSPEAAHAFGEALTDTGQIQQWRDEIAMLQARIGSSVVRIETGTATSASTTNAARLNTLCPVTGKPVDPSKTFTYENHLVAFCCDQCKAAFEKDPKPYLARLELKVAAADKKESK